MMARQLTRDSWIRIALVAAAVAVFARSLFFGFVYDDTAIVLHNSVIHGWHSLIDVWRHPYWANESGPDSAGLYRPLLMAIFAVLWNGAHGFAFAFHLLAVVSHAVATVLVWRLLQRAVGRWTAAGAALWFALLPVHVEAVANIANSSEVLVAVWTLLLCWVLAPRAAADPITPPSGWRLAAAGALYAAALTTKESGAMTPILALLAVYAWRSPALASAGAALDDAQLARRSAAVPSIIARASARWLRAWWRLLAVWAGVTVVVAAARHQVLGGFVSGGSIAAPGLDGLTASQRIWSMLALGGRVARLLFWPGLQNPHYGPTTLPASHGPTLAALLTIATIIVALASAARAAVRGRSRDARPLCAVLWCLIAFLPASNLLTATGQILAERTLYLSSIGAAMLVAWALDRLVAVEWPRASIARRSLALAGAVVLAFACVRDFVHTRSYTMVWKDNLTVVAGMVGADSASYRGYQLLAIELQQRGHAAEAQRYYAHAYSLYPRNPTLAADYADFLLQAGNYREAIPVARSLVAHDDMRTNRRAVTLLLTAISNTYGVDSLMPAARSLEATSPSASSALFVGMGYVALGDTNAARAEYRAGLRRAPGDSLLTVRLAAISDR